MTKEVYIYYTVNVLIFVVQYTLFCSRIVLYIRSPQPLEDLFNMNDETLRHKLKFVIQLLSVDSTVNK